ncbi:PD-(D/E)XK nuclease family protein [Noviherbaspirillum massiliense]|uniref:PD-(D/E)XK nuclease family protein n=1 Tax=Noviherbaspirillum massiliense TaxID=1465823 RepID=UPI0002D68393|nr:PD-(D/E)XK nuclease family protein [Noviherbaspirillum massiliense]
MKLSVRPKVYSLPSYSLTGDLLGYLRCGLQYRYTRIGKLPSSRPVQLWFGEFIHGVLEEAFRRYQERFKKGEHALPPWAADELNSIFELIKKRLSARGLVPWDDDLERLGDLRATAAIQEMGPHLFPLIHRAEVRLYGARALPSIDKSWEFREADRYEMVGVIDVVTHVELQDPKHQDNPIVRAVLASLPKMPVENFEVIIDYKGMRRPPVSGGSYWAQYAWQLQTYGELRRRQPDALPVAAGVLVYLNELYPTKTDFETIRREVKRGKTDIPPKLGSEAEAILKSWPSKEKEAPLLPFDYRLQRSLRALPINDESIADALNAFDEVVKRIETCKGKEAKGLPVMDAWERNASDENTCTVCDSRTYCPDFQKTFGRKTGETHPKLPGFKSKEEGWGHSSRD